MLKLMREQVSAVMAQLTLNRRPALRRSDAPHALLATDLPLAAAPEAADLFLRQMKALGWQVTPSPNGWLLLDAPVPAPEQTDVPGDASGECGCCIAVLTRHPDAGDAAAEIRALVKAAEAGRQPFERLCSRLHGALAEKLRRHEELPGALLPYLCRAYHDIYDGRNDT